MSRNKFAAITSSLLARKGEAAPWPHAAPAWAPAFVAETPPFVAPEPPSIQREVKAPVPRVVETPPQAAALKRCTVRLTQREYERLGILAVKKDMTRQQLLQAALAEVLAGMARSCAPDCGCLNGCSSI